MSDAREPDRPPEPGRPPGPPAPHVPPPPQNPPVSPYATPAQGPHAAPWAGVRPPRHPTATRLFLVAVGASVLTFVSLWMPWTYVTADYGTGVTSSRSLNGFQSVPEDCSFVCQPDSTSPPAVILLVAAGLAALCGAGWLLNGEHQLGRALRFLAQAALALTVLNAGWLYIGDLVNIGDRDNMTALPHIGPFVALAAAVTTLVCTVRARKFLGGPHGY